MCPTMGALRRTLTADVGVTSQCTSRAFSVSARRFDGSNKSAPSAPAPVNPTPTPNPDSRKARAANALNQITRLGANRRIQPGGLAKGSFPSGQVAGQAVRRGPPREPSQSGAARAEGGLKIIREARGPATAKEGARPPGPMVRAPAQLKLSRNTGNSTVGARRGPNLRGRDGKSGGGGREQGPKRREKKSGDAAKKSIKPSDVKLESKLSDGMVQHLLRLQRGEWDRTAYEPKYAPGSFAANKLIHDGRELFRGEAPPVKIWGMLEKRIGVVGMHNAEAHLKVRRVTDLDDDSLGERREHFETGSIEIQTKTINKAPEATKATPPNAPAAAAKQAAAFKAPAAKQATVSQ